MQHSGLDLRLRWMSAYWRALSGARRWPPHGLPSTHSGTYGVMRSALRKRPAERVPGMLRALPLLTIACALVEAAHVHHQKGAAWCARTRQVVSALEHPRTQAWQALSSQGAAQPMLSRGAAQAR